MAAMERDHPRVAALRERSCHVGSLRRRVDRLCLAWSAVMPTDWRVDIRRQVVLTAALAVKRRRPDLVIVSQGESYDGLPFAHVCRRLDVKYVLISQKASELYWPEDYERPRHRSAHVDAVSTVFVSEHNRRVTEDQLGGEIATARVMRNPVLLGHDAQLQWPDETRIRIACVGRLYTPDKGQDALLRVIARERWRSRDLEVDFYGSGGHRVGLEELAEKLKLTNVRFHGSTDDILGVWRTHHIMALPSRAEGMPLAVAEAMMCGRPVVVTDVGGNAEMVEDGVTGFLASGAELDAFDATLERAWRCRAEWESMGQRAAMRARQLFPGGPEAAGDALADLVETVAR